MKTLGILMLGLLLLVNSGCAGNNSPQTVAANVAHNGTILVGAVDKVQDFVIAEEKAGRIPTPQARAVMEVIGRALTAAKKVPPLLDKLNSLPGGSPESAGVIGQIQEYLTFVSTETGQILMPISDEATRKQIGLLAVELNKTIGTIYGWILQRGVK